MSRGFFSNRLHVAVLIFVVIFSVAFYWALGRITRSSFTDQYLMRQETFTRAEATNLTSFFQVFGDSIAVFAGQPGIDHQDSETGEVMDSFMNQWRDGGLVKGIVLTDENGIVIFNSNVDRTPDIGGSLSDRDYFLWAKNEPGEGEYYVGEPVISRLGSSEGEMIVPVASPVFRDGDFSGVIAASVKLESLTERYFELMKIDEEAIVYLISSDGEILFNSSGQVPEANFFKVWNTNLPVNSSEEGSLVTGSNLFTYSSVNLENQRWILIMVNSISGVDEVSLPFFYKQLTILLILTSTVVIFLLLIRRENADKDASRRQETV